MSFSSSPDWKPQDQGDGSWTSQGWPDGAEPAASSAPNPGSSLFRVDDVDGMFVPGVFDAQMHLPQPVQPFGSSGALGGLGGLSMRSEESDTSSLLHILGGDLYGAMDLDGGDDMGGGKARLGESSRRVGRLDELNGSEYVPLSPDRSKPNKQDQEMSGYAQGAFAANTASRRMGHFPQLTEDAHHRDLQGYEHQGRDCGRSVNVMSDGAHGQHWLPEHGSRGPSRGGMRGGLAMYGYGGGGPRGGGHYGGPVPTGGRGSRGGAMNHVRGGGPEPGARGHVGAGPAAGGRGVDYRAQPQFAKGGRPMMPPHHQQHPTQMNGRVDPRDDLVKPSDLLEPTVKNVDVSAVQKADFDGNARRSSASSSTGNPALAEEAQRAVDEAVSAAEKEAADKAKKEKKKNKKDKTKRGKDETSPNASTTTSIQSTPLMDAQQAQEEVPPMPDQVSEATANSESKAEESERVRLVAEQKRKMEESAKKKKTEEKKKLEEAAKVAAAANKKPKEDSKKKNKNRQHLIRQQVYESDSEDDGTVPSTLQAKLQAVKEWFVSFGKPQPRRRARSKTYRIWFNRCLQTMIVVLVGSLLTTLIAPSSRHDSSCRLMYEAVRRLCKDIADADCKGIASKARSLCYILESVPGMRLLELLVLFVVRLGRLSIFSRHQHSGNKGLIARCRLLPLQHHCSLGGTGHHDRLRWHLDTVCASTPH